MYFFGIVLGFCSILNGHFKIGIKRLLHPVGYWRYPIFNLIKKKLKNKNDIKILDIGSPKLLALYLSIIKGYEIYATDIQDPEIYSVWKSYYTDFFNCIKNKKKTFYKTEFQDGRKLSYPDHYFDFVYSVSVLEHISESGDSLAIKEIERVLKCGGSAIIEVPFAKKRYDTYINQEVYGKKYSGTPVFYQRHYDKDTIYSRIINPLKKLYVKDINIYSERLPFERVISKLPLIFQVPILFVSPLLSFVNHRKISYDLIKMDPEKIRDNAMDIVIHFKKK